MKWGVIGTGNMGEILIDAWIKAKVIEESNLFITNRTLSKAQALKEKYGGIHVCEQANDVAKEADIIFICTKPVQIYPLLVEIHSNLRPDQCLISITSPYSVERLEQLVPCQVARIIPSITNRALSGMTLFSFGKNTSNVMRGYLLQSFRLFSQPQIIEENITRISSDIVSCGPAFFGFLAERFIDAACLETRIDKQTAHKLMENMFIGFGKLLEDGHYSLPELIEKVCVKGGVTGEGIKVMEAELNDMFHKLIQKTHDKFEEDIETISYQMLEG